MTRNPRDEVLSWRMRKDTGFADPRGSPLAPERRAGFTGLPYFDYDERYRAVVALEAGPGVGQRLMIQRTGGDEVEYERIGFFRLALPVGEIKLAAYRATERPDDDELFVPFKDATNGAESYGAGRYVEAHPSETERGKWVVDLNMAYSPFCAYDESFTCPLPPAENHLKVRVPVGERALGDDH
ncbi:MAG: DUF1684 domain-containing protein [Thermoplasmatota archaeon]